jgi:RNA polymerase sigma-70 factor, ECF subfamily
MGSELAGPASVIAINECRTATKGKSDEALIAKIASGNRLAMQVLFARHHTRIYRFILRMAGEAATADALTSEVFLAVWRKAHQFERRSAASTWLLAIARHKALAELRRLRDPLHDGDETATSDPQDDPEARFAVKHRGEILRRCLNRLSREHREIIDLVYYHEKSMQAVAEIVGIPCNTVKTRMSDARNKLAQLLAANEWRGGRSPNTSFGARKGHAS